MEHQTSDGEHQTADGKHHKSIYNHNLSVGGVSVSGGASLESGVSTLDVSSFAGSEVTSQCTSFSLTLMLHTSIRFAYFSWLAADVDSVFAELAMSCPQQKPKRAR